MKTFNLFRIFIFAVAVLALPLAGRGSSGKQGPPGENGVSIYWLGSLAAAPSTPQVNDAYHDTTLGISLIWDGSSWPILAENGINGTQGLQGPIGPQGPQGLQGLAGTNGTNGISINWKGSLASPPASPALNDAYYNTTDKTSYIWGGTSWQILAKDGVIGPQGIQGPQGVTGPTMPVIQSLSVFGVPANPGGTITVAVAAQSAEGLGLIYKWGTGPAGWVISGGQGTSIISITAPSTCASGGTATVIVTDTQGRAAAGTVVISTAGNLAPVISTITASPNPVAKYGSTTIAVTANDPNGDSLGYAWSVPAGWSITGGNGTAQITVSAPDQYSDNGIATVTVTDGQGGSVDGSITLATEANLAPVIASVGASPDQVGKGGSVTIGAFAQDPNGDRLNYAWTVPAGWTVTAGDGTSVITVSAPDEYANHQAIFVLVYDGYGGSSLGGVGVNTVDDSYPVIESISIYPQPATAANFVCDASDSDGDTLDYAWTVGGVYPGVVTGASWYWYSQGIPGYYRAGVTVDDGNGGVVSGSSFMNVSSGSPWPKFRRDIQSTGISPYAGPVSNTLKWRYQTGSDVYSSPAIGADGNVYVGSTDWYLYAIKPDGTLKWSYLTGNSVNSSPAIGADGTVYVGSDDHYLYAIK